MELEKFIATTLREYMSETLKIGDNSNFGEILDKTDNQFFVKNNNTLKRSWIHKSLVKKIDEPIKDIPLKNKGWISPNYVISAFANPISQKKIKNYSDEMKLKMNSHEFPPIKGYPLIIEEDDIERFEYFLSGKKITKNDLGKYAWVVTDGHHRVVSALNVGLQELKTVIDYSYVDENDFI